MASKLQASLKSPKNHVNISSLNKSHIKSVLPYLAEILASSELPYVITEEILLKRNLRNYSINSAIDSENHTMQILVHKIDGRLLLTGPSGIYQEFL